MLAQIKEDNMKRFIYFFVIAIFFVISGCNNEKNIIQIRGKIIGSQDSIVKIIFPISKNYFVGNEIFIKMDSSKEFYFDLPMEQIGQVSLHYAWKEFRLFLKPGDKINVLINQDDPNLTITFTGANADGQNYLNNLNRQEYINAFKNKFINDTIACQLEDWINSNRNQDIQSLDKLFNNHKIDKIFYDYALKEIDCYYAFLTVTIASSQYAVEDRVFSKQIGELWAKTFNKYPVVSKDGIYSSWWIDYANNFIIDYNEWYLKNNIKPELYYFGQASKYLSNEHLEYYKASKLFIVASRERYEKELLELYNSFKTDYPKSVYIPNLDLIMEPIQTFYEKTKIDIDSSIIFKDYRNIKSLKSVVEKFNGKKLYVDVWATWCGPCKQELKRSKELAKLLLKYNYELLYISIDFDEQDELWRDMIKFYNLSGKHLRTNIELHKELINMESQSSSFSIPKHWIFDKNGKLVVNNAFGSMDIDSLESQLRNY